MSRFGEMRASVVDENVMFVKLLEFHRCQVFD